MPLNPPIIFWLNIELGMDNISWKFCKDCSFGKVHPYKAMGLKTI